MRSMKGIANHVKTALKLAIAVGLIVWLVQSGRLDFKQLLNLLTPFYIATCSIVAFLALFTNNIRWYILLRAQGFEMSFYETFKLTFIGIFFNTAMPGGVGGDLIKGYYIIRDQTHRKMAAATSVLLDRLIGFFSMTCVGLVAILLNYDFIQRRHELMILSATIIILFSAFVFLFLTAFSRRANRFVQKFFGVFPGGQFFQKLYDVLVTYRNQPRALALALTVSLVTQFFSILFFWIVGGVLESRGVRWQAYAFVVPLGMIALAAPIAPAGIGVGQAAFFVLFNWYLGYESQVGPASITAYQVVQISWSLLGAYYYFSRKAPVLVEA
jgi:glycosyltransferase 2 family protein